MRQQRGAGAARSYLPRAPANRNCRYGGASAVPLQQGFWSPCVARLTPLDSCLQAASIMHTRASARAVAACNAAPAVAVLCAALLLLLSTAAADDDARAASVDIEPSRGVTRLTLTRRPNTVRAALGLVSPRRLRYLPRRSSPSRCWLWCAVMYCDLVVCSTRNASDARCSPTRSRSRPSTARSARWRTTTSTRTSARHRSVHPSSPTQVRRWCCVTPRC